MKQETSVKRETNEAFRHISEDRTVHNQVPEILKVLSVLDDLVQLEITTFHRQRIQEEEL
jgi:hypothetical protein